MLHFRLRSLPHPSPATTKTEETGTTLPNDNDESAEDLFSSSLSLLFPDDAPSFHGNPGQCLVYASPRYGDLTIMVPSYPGQSEGNENAVERGRKLFAHLLWSAAMVVAEGVEDADTGVGGSTMWRVKGERVLELGAGTALPSLISALANASAVTITDHPSSPALTGAIAFNTTHNLPPTHPTRITIAPHEWGTLDTDPWAVSQKASYTRIIAADCFWMRSELENLVRSMRWFLAPGGKVWVVAGFHTGRAVVADFFETAVREGGFVVEEIYERDLNGMREDGGEVRREWRAVREGEGPENRKRWCVVAVLASTWI